MADEDLRALEAASRSGAVLDVLRFARALERSGRVEDAVDALVPHLAAAPVRAEVARLAPTPRFGTLDGESDRALRRRPALAWTAETRDDVSEVAASPLGLLVVGDAVSVHDLGGRERWIAGQGLAYGVGEVVVKAAESGVVGIDVWTGEELWELAEGALRAWSHEWLVLSRDDGPERTSVLVHRVERGGTTRPALHAAITAPAPQGVLKVRLTSDLVVLDVAGRDVRAHRFSGELAWRERGSVAWADPHGLVLVLLDTDVVPRRVVHRAAADTELAPPSGTFPCRASKRHVAFTHWGRDGVILDRATGAVAARLETFVSFDASVLGEELLVSYDAPPWSDAYNDARHHGRADHAGGERAAAEAFARSSLVARTIGGGELWRIPAPSILARPPVALAASRGWLYAASDDGRLVCLAPP